MKIAMVSDHASPLAELGGVDAGGQNLHVAELSAAMARHGHDVTVYTRHDGSHAEREVMTGAGYRVVHVPAGPPHPVPKDEIVPFLGEFCAFLRDCWTRERPDLVHAHFWMSGVASEPAARQLAIPLVVTFHALGCVKRRYQGTADTSPPARIPIERIIAHRAAHVVATCSDEVGELSGMGVPRTRISVVPCGVDLERFTPGGPADRRGRAHRLVSVGRMVRRKGFDLAIAALAQLPDTELIIAGGESGDDPEIRRLAGVAAERGVAGRVRLIGHVPHTAMPGLLRSADVVLCTPWYEPFGIVPLEAMACGKPVVATAVGGLLDTVCDGTTGRLVAPATPEAVAAAVRPLLDDPFLRETWGRAGLRRVRRGYSWDRIGVRTLGTYQAIASDRPVRGTRSAGVPPVTPEGAT
ncbi:glycosyltransferase [Nocardia asiatica]|uniref:glycosyltransferase n=1 Tax=Nocardia asiatica TaxID=209252 RepID=UPI0024545CEA|nr:glycosyltransferase [Nocardia asiatica]